MHQPHVSISINSMVITEMVAVVCMVRVVATMPNHVGRTSGHGWGLN